MGCGPLGEVSRAWNLRTGERVELQGIGSSPAVGSGVLWEPGRKGGLWSLPAAEPVRQAGWVDPILVAPPATDGSLCVLPTADELQILSLETGRRAHVSARPAPWYTPVVYGERVAWVDLRSADEQGEDVWMLSPGAGGEGAPLAKGPGNERHVALSGSSVAWIDDKGVVIQSLESGLRRRWDGDVHTNTMLSLWEDTACWEIDEEGDVNVVCSDGTQIGGDGHQRFPSRFEEFLLYRQDGRTWYRVVGQVESISELDED